MIPKIIHFTWFSGEEYPKNIQECLATWKKVLPDFEIKLWTMDMARDLGIPYVNEALDSQKWAFASDVVRAYAVWKYGGIYMDSDIYVLKRFDEFLEYPMCFFMEINEKRWKLSNSQQVVDNEGHCIIPNGYVKGRQIQAAIFMGEKGQPCLKNIIDYYRNIHFIHDDGTLAIDIISPYIYAKQLEKYGFLYVDKEQEFGGIKVYDSSYIGLSKYDYSNNAVALHLAAHSWDSQKKIDVFRRKIRSLRGVVLLKKLIKPLIYRK